MSECAKMADTWRDYDTNYVCQVHQDEWWPCKAFTDSGKAECDSCCVDEPSAFRECSKSKRPCGHHCNHSWSHDVCDWCSTDFDSESVAAIAVLQHNNALKGFEE